MPKIKKKYISQVQHHLVQHLNPGYRVYIKIMVVNAQVRLLLSRLIYMLLTLINRMRLCKSR